MNIDKKYCLSCLLAFVLGVLLTLFLAVPNRPRYIEFGSQGNEMLDSSNGNVYAKSDKGWFLKYKIYK